MQNEYAGLDGRGKQIRGVDQRTQIEHFANELDKLVDRFCDEYSMPYASVVGVLAFKTNLLMKDWEASNEDAEDHG